MLSELQDKCQPYPIILFREQVLWTRDVNLVLDANQAPLLKLYQRYLKQGKSKLAKEGAIRLMCEENTDAKISFKDANCCFAWSLQTCQALVRDSESKCQHMSFLEFNEMVGRVADIWLSESDKDLHEKIIILLDQWLPLVGETRREAQYFESPELLESD